MSSLSSFYTLRWIIAIRGGVAVDRPMTTHPPTPPSTPPRGSVVFLNCQEIKFFFTAPAWQQRLTRWIQTEDLNLPFTTPRPSLCRAPTELAAGVLHQVSAFFVFRRAGARPASLPGRDAGEGHILRAYHAQELYGVDHRRVVHLPGRLLHPPNKMNC